MYRQWRAARRFSDCGGRRLQQWGRHPWSACPTWRLRHRNGSRSNGPRSDAICLRSAATQARSSTPPPPVNVAAVHIIAVCDQRYPCCDQQMASSSPQALGSGDRLAVGVPWALSSIAAAVALGGVELSGGRGGMLGPAAAGCSCPMSSSRRCSRLLKCRSSASRSCTA